MMKIFLSSNQKEFAKERQALKTFVESDPLLGRFFKVFLFEDLPAGDRRPTATYINEVDRCGVYVGLFGAEYGPEDSAGFSATEQEFNRATENGIPRLIFIKGSQDKKQSPKMRALIMKANRQLIRRRFKDIAGLKSALSASLVEHLETLGSIQSGPFEERPAIGATLQDLNNKAIEKFVFVARGERQFPLSEKSQLVDILSHLHLLNLGKPTQAAILLFGRDPQKFLPSAEIRCMHFHGLEIQRPVPFYRIFKGTVFEQVDQAVDFVLSKVNLSVGTRAISNQAPVEYELPPNVVRETIVNALSHRDYASAGSVQVSVFTDRVEVWNPGTLPDALTAEGLRHPHGSIPRNHRLCEILFLAKYIEKYGTGTLMMIRESLAHHLPEPDFAQRGNEFTVTLWRDWITTEMLVGLNERQRQIIKHVKIKGRVSNSEYRNLTKASESTALRELRHLTLLGLLEKVGGTGQSIYYALPKRKLFRDPKEGTRHEPVKPAKVKRQPVMNPPNPSKPPKNGSRMAHRKGIRK